MTHCKGHTLIEVLIIIGLVALLALAASPFTGAWVRSADIVKVQGDLTQAVGRAKSIAQRNAIGSLNASPVAAICIAADNTLTLRQATPAGANPAELPDCNPVAGTQVWSTTLDRDVRVTVGDPPVAVSCVCFDNKGLLTSAAQCAGCTTNSTVTLTAAGTENDTVQIY